MGSPRGENVPTSESDETDLDPGNGGLGDGSSPSQALPYFAGPPTHPRQPAAEEAHLVKGQTRYCSNREDGALLFN